MSDSPCDCQPFSLFHKPRYQINTLLGFSYETLCELAGREDPFSKPAIFPSPPYPSHFILAMKGTSDEISAVLRSAEEFGLLLCPAVPATRTRLCRALAAIEIS
jgi:hypothetical protein